MFQPGDLVRVINAGESGRLLEFGSVRSVVGITPEGRLEIDDTLGNWEPERFELIRSDAVIPTEQSEAIGGGQ